MGGRFLILPSVVRIEMVLWGMTPLEVLEEMVRVMM
jgi:hypothetical protein